MRTRYPGARMDIYTLFLMIDDSGIYLWIYDIDCYILMLPNIFNDPLISPT